MRIISKHKDYYDSCSHLGQDQGLIYNRETSIIQIQDDIKMPVYLELYPPKETYYRTKVHPIIVGFCGKTYVVFAHGVCSDFAIGTEPVKGLTFQYSSYNHSDKDSYRILFGEEIFAYVEEKEKSVERLREFNQKYNIQKYKQFIEQWDNKENINLFRRFGTPVFEIHYTRNYFNRYEATINPILSLLHWYKRFDTFSAFQEISMFLSGVLGNIEKGSTALSDKEKILTHGFDLKSSFRKESTKKR